MILACTVEFVRTLTQARTPACGCVPILIIIRGLESSGLYLSPNIYVDNIETTFANSPQIEALGSL